MGAKSKILRGYRVTMERDAAGMIWVRLFLRSVGGGDDVRGAVAMMVFTETVE